MPESGGVCMSKTVKVSSFLLVVFAFLAVVQMNRYEMPEGWRGMKAFDRLRGELVDTEPAMEKKYRALVEREAALESRKTEFEEACKQLATERQQLAAARRNIEEQQKVVDELAHEVGNKWARWHSGTNV